MISEPLGWGVGIRIKKGLRLLLQLYEKIFQLLQKFYSPSFVIIATVWVLDFIFFPYLMFLATAFIVRVWACFYYSSCEVERISYPLSNKARFCFLPCRSAKVPFCGR
jgi:hypothetical protein